MLLSCFAEAVIGDVVQHFPLRVTCLNVGTVHDLGGRILRSHERFLFSRHNYSTPLTRDGQNM
jgi:hypothetical protein